MRRLTSFQVVLTAMIALLCSSVAEAFDVSKYAIQSKLATGKWVKISIPEDGVYEITYNELRDMGFSNPANVRIYGNGGYSISEKLDGSAIDDLQPVHVLRTRDKLCFYGKGHTQFSLTGGATLARFTRAFNPYSLEGCYFLTEKAPPSWALPQPSRWFPRILWTAICASTTSITRRNWNLSPGREEKCWAKTCC